jgi:hypothetical protein
LFVAAKIIAELQRVPRFSFDPMECESHPPENVNHRRHQTMCALPWYNVHINEAIHKKRYLNAATGIVQALPHGFFRSFFLLHPFAVSSAKKRKWNKGKSRRPIFLLTLMLGFYWPSPSIQSHNEKD